MKDKEIMQQNLERLRLKYKEMAMGDLEPIFTQFRQLQDHVQWIQVNNSTLMK